MKKLKLRSLCMCLIALCGVASTNTVWAKSTEEKAKDFVDDVAIALKKTIEKMGNDLSEIQSYLDNYAWKGLLQSEATSGPATLKHMQLNGHVGGVVVRPGERIEGVVECFLDREKCSGLRLYHVLIGIHGRGPQTAIANEFGMNAGGSLEQFALIAPQEPGIYEVRFRCVKGLFKGLYLEGWLDKDGNEPGPSTTMGIIVVTHYS